MDCLSSAKAWPELESASPYCLLLRAASLIPISHYLIGLTFIFLVFLYYFFEMHFFGDLFTGFRGQPVALTFNSSSRVYQEIVSKCKILNSRYLSTFWLSGPHIQTAFLTFFGRPPIFNYKRQLFKLDDGGTIALDWLMHTDVMNPSIQVSDEVHEKIPIVVVIPGLTSDSDSQYVRHLVFQMAKSGRNVVVSNHRGLGGVSMTSDCFYNAGWTDDVRKIIGYLHCQYPNAPLLAVGTSIGANVLVKYLGEDGDSVPIIGAAAICSPWDLLIGDRFIRRRLVQRLYDKALAFGLKGYAQLHQAILSRLANWEGIAQSQTVRDFDNYATRLVGKYETVDTYYRRCSSAGYVGNVMVPLLCISALDDPVCTREAIPWDECRFNKNVVLATTKHGGHLAYFEGITAKSVWWVRAVDEFLCVLQSSPLIHREQKVQVSSTNPLDSSIDQAPDVNFEAEGMVTAISKEPMCDADRSTDDMRIGEPETRIPGEKDNEHILQETVIAPAKMTSSLRDEITLPIKMCLNQLSRNSNKSMWLLAYVAIITTWPVLGSALFWFFKKRFQKVVKERR